MTAALIAALILLVGAVIASVGITITMRDANTVRPEARWDPLPYAPYLHQPEGPLVLPLRVVRQFCDPALVTRCLVFDKAKLDDLERDLRADGQLEPVVLKVDCAGRAVVKDGYHRILVLDRIGATHVALQVEDGSGAPCLWGRPLASLFTGDNPTWLGWVRPPTAGR